MVKSIFLDIDTIVRIDNQAWVVDKSQPNIPIYKLSKSEFNLIKSGIYRSQNNKISFNGKVYWLPTNLMNILKIKAKSTKSNFSNLAISLQEFLNKDIIGHLNMDIDTNFLNKFKNVTDDIYVICSKETKDSYQLVINNIQNELIKIGLKFKNVYYINDNLYNQNEDEVKFKKMRLLIQHLIGYKTEGKKFIDEEITRYDQVSFYDNVYDTLNISDQINGLFEIILSNTEHGLRDVIKEDVIEYKPILYVNKVNENKYNQIEEKKVIINISNAIMKFESFKKF